jgi:hypothetical protein
VTGLVVAILFIAAGPLSQYSNGVAERTIRVRQTASVSMPLPDVLPKTDGYLAVLECEHIGEIWWLMFPDGVVESFLVIDCAGDWETISWMERNNIIGEVDFQTAQRHGFVGVGGWAWRVEPVHKHVSN